ncbi:hypothetical protein EIY72_14430 [Pseudomonas vancouverensis]|uniref:Uncharacterized protein n=1 Tax=Pseudomonas vancouverensis TaxID=95300 RepID=A0A4R4K3J3_PSEVA|nr:hypothetical protein F7R09_24695 [Pseudomonas vancouverensis]TDB61930.1 hypothetical protein EIY72_14430 [Pseudomonas vancouverensis]
MAHSFAGALPGAISIGDKQCRQGWPRLLATRHFRPIKNLWERACSRLRSVSLLIGRLALCHREQARSHGEIGGLSEEGSWPGSGSRFHGWRRCGPTGWVYG